MCCVIKGLHYTIFTLNIQRSYCLTILILTTSPFYKSMRCLTLCVPMDSSFWFYTINLGQSIVYIEGVTGCNFPKILYFFLEINFVLANSTEPDEMLNNICSISSGSSLFANVPL